MNPGTGPAAPPAPVPAKRHEKVWVVIGPGGDRHHIDREPDEGIEAWAKGQNITVFEYTLTRVVCRRTAGKTPETRGGAK